VTAVGRASVDEAAHKFIQPWHVEGAMFHADVHVIGPSAGHLLAAFVAKIRSGVAALIVNRLALVEQLDRFVYPFGHQSPLWICVFESFDNLDLDAVKFI
jgi:hypothetical protein